MHLKHVIVGAAVFFGCAKEPASAPPLSEEFPVQRVAAVVNGRPVSETELLLRMKDKGGLPSRDDALDALIALELQAQKAESQGLHKTPEFQAELEQHAARLRDARRVKLAKSWRMQTLAQLPPPSDEQVKRWFDEHQALVRAEWRLRRVTTRSREDADKALAALQAGKPFSDVAASFVNEPMELGPLQFDALPEPWWKALERLQPGETTGVLPAGERFVILQLVERTELPPFELAQVKNRVAGVLQAQAYEETLARLVAEQKAAATIEKRPLAPAPQAPGPASED